MKIKLGEGLSVETNGNDARIYKSVDEWKAEGERRFGKDILKWRVKCPMCGHIATVEDFKNAGVESPDDAFFNCIGRYIGKGTPKEGDSSGCNWAAYGLFGIPRGGAIVIKSEKDGFQIFDFAGEDE